MKTTLALLGLICLLIAGWLIMSGFSAHHEDSSIFTHPSNFEKPLVEMVDAHIQAAPDHTVLAIYSSGEFTTDTKWPAFFTSIIVLDIEASAEWYQQALEMELIALNHYPDYGFSQANLRNNDLQLELIQTAKTIAASSILEDSPAKSRISGLFKIGMAIDQFEQTIDRLQTLGVEFQGSIVQDPVSGRRMIIALDPEGNRIQLFEKAKQP